MRKSLIIAGCVVCLLGAGGLLAWHFWPQPPPPTATELIETVMKGDTAEMSDEELGEWMREVAAKAERLPPHEMQKLVEQAIGNEELRERFESLGPEERRRLANMVSEEQRARMMAKMAVGMVEMLKAMPPSARRAMFERMRERRGPFKGKAKGEATKERVARWLSSTTPTQRAEFVRAMREMRRMMKEAGIRR